MLNYSADAKLKQLMDVVKSYWYLGILGFGGTPTTVALLLERISIPAEKKHQQQPKQQIDYIWQLVATLHAIPGSTSSQLVAATAASHAGILGGAIALLLYTAPGFLLMSCAGVIRRQCSNSIDGLETTTILGTQLFKLLFKLFLLPGIQPVALAWTIQKSIFPAVAQLDGLQRIVVACSCAWAFISFSRGRGRILNFVVPAILASGGLVTFLEDFRSEVPIANHVPLPIAEASMVHGQDVPFLVSKDVDSPSPVLESEAMRAQKGFGGIPVLNGETPEPFDFDLNLEQVAEELDEVQARFDNYLDEYFGDDLRDVEEYTEYFASNSPTDSEPAEMLDLDNLNFGTPDLEPSYREENVLGTNSISAGEDLRLSDPNESTETATTEPDNRTNALIQQQPRGGSIEVGVRSDGTPPTPGVCVVILWLLGLFVTTFVKLDNDLYRVFAMNYRMGSFVSTGGPTLLPLLAAELIPTNIVSEQEFFHGTLLAQSLPGSIFNMAAYLGAIQQGWLGAMVAQIGMTLPGLLLVMAMVPHWSRLRREHAWFRSTSRGVMAAAVGLLCSICLSTYGRCIQKGADVMLFVGALCLVPFTNMNAPIVIALGAVIGAVFSRMNLDPMVYQ